jgi:hypothetical protein
MKHGEHNDLTGLNEEENRNQNAASSNSALAAGRKTTRSVMPSGGT